MCGYCRGTQRQKVLLLFVTTGLVSRLQESDLQRNIPLN